MIDIIFPSDNFNKELPSHLKSGHDPAPGDLIDAARNLSIEDIDNHAGYP